jgi:hypothetical protein
MVTFGAMYGFNTRGLSGRCSPFFEGCIIPPILEKDYDEKRESNKKQFFVTKLGTVAPRLNDGIRRVGLA